VRSIPPDTERCVSMVTGKSGKNAGGRCQKRHVDGRLCQDHVENGALIPDAWLPSGIPVFTIRPRR
jgi:hypothetical protein